MSRCIDCQAEMSACDAQMFLQCLSCRRADFRSRRRLLPRIPTFDDYIEQEHRRQPADRNWGRTRQASSRCCVEGK